MTEAASALNKRDPLAEEFLRYLGVERNASSRTLKAYRQALTAFRAENKTPWKKCTVDDFRDYLFAIMKRGQARSYVRLQFSALRTLYQFLAARKGLRRNPVREVQLPKIEKKLPLVLTRQQIEELLAAPTRVAKNRAAPVWMPLGQRSKRTRLPGGFARAGGNLALSRDRQCTFRTAFHKQSAQANIYALHLAYPQALLAAHIDSNLHQST